MQCECHSQNAIGRRTHRRHRIHVQKFRVQYRLVLGFPWLPRWMIVPVDAHLELVRIARDDSRQTVALLGADPRFRGFAGGFSLLVDVLPK